MTPAEETNERNACDEWFHEKGGATIQETWVERGRRAEADEAYRILIESAPQTAFEIQTYNGWKRMSEADIVSAFVRQGFTVRVIKERSEPK